MLIFKSILYFIGTIISALIIGTIAFLLFWMPVKYRYKLISKWAIFNILWLKIICKIKLNVIGRENISNKPCVIISNHQSTYETFAFQTIFSQQTWVLKRELLWIPIFGWGLALLKPIVIDRSKKITALKKIIQQGSDRLKKNINIIIFPEGTRQPYNKLGKYQSGGILVAQKSNADILPVYHNAGRLWPKGSFIKKPGVITVVIGERINPKNKTALELTKKIKAWTLAQEIKIK